MFTTVTPATFTATFRTILPVAGPSGVSLLITFFSFAGITNGTPPSVKSPVGKSGARVAKTRVATAASETGVKLDKSVRSSNSSSRNFRDTG